MNPLNPSTSQVSPPLLNPLIKTSINSPFLAELDTFSQLCLRINARALTVTIPSAFCSLITKTSISRPIENFSLKLGQLIEGEVLAVKPYGFFIDLGGASGLLHQSSITNGSIRSLREVFREGEIIKALISEIDLEKGRIGLNTALLENSAGELIIDKQKVMQEATERALKTKALFDKKEQDK